MGASAVSAYFVATPDGLQPAAEARSPWAEDMLHGRLLGGLVARTIQAGGFDDGLRVARLTLDMFRVAPMRPLQVAATVVRDGRRVRAVDVTITCEGVEVGRARVLLLRPGVQAAGAVWTPARWDPPPPDSLPIEGFAPGAWDIRVFSPGGFWSIERKELWARDGWELVAGEPLSPLVRVALAADLPNPVANGGGAGLEFINADLTLFLAREPVSEWIGLSVAQHVAAEGIAVGTCDLYDVDGPIGSSTVCALSNTALAPADE